jgi:hypothetical protein
MNELERNVERSDCDVIRYVIRYFLVICLKGLRNSTKILSRDHEILSQDCRSLGQDLKSGPPEHEAGVLTTERRHSVLRFVASDGG